MPTRTQAPRRPTPARFGRPAGGAPRSAGRRPAQASRRSVIVPRRKPQKTGMAKVMGSIGGALPGGSGKGGKGARGGAKGKGMGAGVALLAGAAGLAMKNRGRIQGMMKRSDKDRVAHADAPANPKVETLPGAGPAGSGPTDSTAPQAG
jgi:hypothetical protein